MQEEERKEILKLDMDWEVDFDFHFCWVGIESLEIDEKLNLFLFLRLFVLLSLFVVVRFEGKF